MSDLDRIVIVGGGQAAARAAQSVRSAGFGGSVTLIGEEPHVPYERPPLSKRLLTSDASAGQIRIHPPEWYATHAIQLRLGAQVSGIDPALKRVRFAGAWEPYDRLILATGARPRRLNVPGSDLPGVLSFRTLDDGLALRQRLQSGTRVVVVGGGLIGLETAASARTRECSVTVIEATDRLMGRAVARELGDFFLAQHRGRGVDVRLRTAVKRFAGSPTLQRVVLDDGDEIEADVAVVGIGVEPNVEVAATAGLDVDDGIVVDACCRTSQPEIYAAGDVVNQPSPLLGRRIRAESYQNAHEQGSAAGLNAVGVEHAYRNRFWFWSDQYDVNLQAVGVPDGTEQVVLRGDVGTGRFMAFYVRAGCIVGVNSVNSGAEMSTAERLMASKRVIDTEMLADPTVSLRKLLVR